ncbi:MAG: uracil-DNA glycosylase [Clostridia bacterium]|nr:uracil-DNA glycosylase [Clostridia bacterium]
MITFNNDWDEMLSPLFESENYKRIRQFLKEEYSRHTIYPSMYDIFNAFKETPYSSVKAVILGQDPYHEPGQAHGLCFSVKNGAKLPPSLVNIYKELETDLGIPPAESGDLTPWAKQGVLLLNATLTVRRGEANSHADCGWREFTDGVIRLLSQRKKPIVFILWGGYARGKKPLIDLSRHFIVESAHPSPLSCYNGFFGSRPFSKTNAYLESAGEQPINWNLTHSNG